MKTGEIKNPTNKNKALHGWHLLNRIKLRLKRIRITIVATNASIMYSGSILRNKKLPKPTKPGITKHIKIMNGFFNSPASLQTINSPVRSC